MDDETRQRGGMKERRKRQTKEEGTETETEGEGRERLIDRQRQR